MFSTVSGAYRSIQQVSQKHVHNNTGPFYQWSPVLNVSVISTFLSAHSPPFWFVSLKLFSNLEKYPLLVVNPLMIAIDRLVVSVSGVWYYKQTLTYTVVLFSSKNVFRNLCFRKISFQFQLLSVPLSPELMFTWPRSPQSKWYHQCASLLVSYQFYGRHSSLILRYHPNRWLRVVLLRLQVELCCLGTRCLWCCCHCLLEGNRTGSSHSAVLLKILFSEGSNWKMRRSQPCQDSIRVSRDGFQHS